MNGLYYYKLVSPYSEDVTKNCKLTINEIDSNFFNLKEYDIKTAEFVREEKTLILTRVNGDKLIVPLKDVVYNLDVETGCNESGASITISYDCVDGPKTVTLGNLLTYENLRQILGSDILTKVITDGSLVGDGTVHSPLGLAGVEKTGMYAPVKEVLDLTKGGKLPDVAKLGTRYLTKEYVSDYGYLYNGKGLNKIKANLEGNAEGWRVPSKADWDALLNSVEDKMDGCICENHDDPKCHVELGCKAGKYLKSECGWISQPKCTCNGDKPATGCTYDFEDNDYIDEEGADGNIPQYKPESPSGVDKYGMKILPSGFAHLNRNGNVVADEFREKAYFWTSSLISEGQDTYVKVFDDAKSGVYQVGECPDPFFSVRLVKDYDGSNYFDSEYIDGVLYKTILFPESGQIWFATNYANKEGFINEGSSREIADVNGGYEIEEQRAEFFINEWNGEYWERKTLKEGDSIVVENPCFDKASGNTIPVCWININGVEKCVDVEIPKAAQSNLEYRVYSEENCDKVLVNTDDLAVERIISLLLPIIERESEERKAEDEKLWEGLSAETEARISADTELSGAVETLREDLDREIEERISADTELWEALSAETEARIEADELLNEKIEAETERAISAETALNEKIDAEIERAISAETALDEKIDAEIERATEREDEIEQELFDEIERATQREDEIDGQLIDWEQNPFTMSAATEDEYNMVLPSKDDNEDHFIKIKFDGNFGEI